MRKISLIIPTYNESHNIVECIKSADFADEIMIVDSFSTDNTVELAREHTDFIVQRAYEYSASQKNWAIPQASHEWILLLDADERVSTELRKEIIALLKSPSLNDFAGYWISRSNYFMGSHLRHRGKDKVIRLFRKSKCQYEDKRVHAEIKGQGNFGFLKSKLYHNTYISFDHHIEKMNRYAWWQAEDYDKKTGRLTAYHFFIKPSWRFFKEYIWQRGFLDGIAGLTLAFIDSYSVFTRYVKVWLLRKGRR